MARQGNQHNCGQAMTTLSTALSISPTPTSEEAAAISAAIELLWPKPTAAILSSSPSNAWRFSGRHWATDQRNSRSRPRR